MGGFDRGSDGVETTGGYRTSAPSRRQWDGDGGNSRWQRDEDSYSRRGLEHDNGGYDSSGMRNRHTRWEPDPARHADRSIDNGCHAATKETDNGPEIYAQSVAAQKGDGDPAPMGLGTKIILGLLIAILFFNLYLKPLLGTVTGESS